MLEVLNKWYQRYLSEEESVLLLILALLFLVLLATSAMFSPRCSRRWCSPTSYRVW
jgi:hypothetical protein